MPPRTIEITDPRLGGIGPKMPIALPYSANAHKLRIYLGGIPILFFAAMAVFGLVVIPSALFGYPFPHNMVIVVAMGLIVLQSAALIGMYGTALADLRLPEPLISIDEAGLFDRRISDEPILWDDIARVVSRTKVNGGILFELKSPRKIRFNPFRVGALFHQWRLPPQAAHIAINRLFGPSFPEAIVYAFAHRHNIPVFEQRKIGGLKQIDPIP